MKINAKKIISIALATIITIGTTGAFASSFKDIDGHWAKSFIEQGEQRGLINGYDQYNFGPELDISKVETVSLVTRILDLSQDEKNKAKDKFQNTILKYDIDTWAVEEFSVALSEGIVDESDLSNIKSSNGADAKSSRQEVFIYLVRAMGLEKDISKWGGSTTLPFKDSGKIDPKAKPYIAILHDLKIINGDQNGNVNAKSPITRAEMSKIINLSYEYVENKKKDSTINVTGQIINKFSANNKDYIEIKDDLGNSMNYEVDRQSVLMINNELVSYESLYAGLTVNAEITKNDDQSIGVVKTLTGQYNVEKFTGVIYNVNKYLNKITLEYKQSNSNKIKSFDVNNKAEITLDGVKADLYDLQEKDKADIEVVNDEITKITAKANIRDIEGVLKEINSKENYITVEDKDGNKTNYQLDKDVTIRRDNRRSEIKKLRIGDKVEVHLEENIALKIDAEVIKTQVKGIVKGKNIRVDRREITVLNTDSDIEEVYLISGDVNIELGSDRAKLDDIGIGFYVTIDLEGEEVVKIEAEPTTLANEHLGTIVSADRDVFFEMRLENGRIIDVIMDKRDITIIDRLGNAIYYRDLKNGDKVLVTGEIFADEIKADEIIRLN